MQIDRSYKLEKCVSTDPNRENLGNIFVSQRHCMATNGIILALVPITSEPEDTTGLMSADALKAGRKLTPAREGAINISLNGSQQLRDGTKIPRPAECKSPRIFHLIRGAHRNRQYKIGLNATMLKTLADALGTDEVVLEFGTSTSAILVTPKQPTPGTVGLIMPIRTTPY
jgi:hypothetical protein